MQHQLVGMEPELPEEQVALDEDERGAGCGLPAIFKNWCGKSQEQHLSPSWLSRRSAGIIPTSSESAHSPPNRAGSQATGHVGVRPPLQLQLGPCPRGEDLHCAVGQHPVARSSG